MTKDDLRTKICMLNESGPHACYCPRSEIGVCTCAMKDEFVDDIMWLIEAYTAEEVHKARIDEVNLTNQVKAYSGVVDRYLYHRLAELQSKEEK